MRIYKTFDRLFLVYLIGLLIVMASCMIFMTSAMPYEVTAEERQEGVQVSLPGYPAHSYNLSR